MNNKTFILNASISSDNPAEIKKVLSELVGGGKIVSTEDGFDVSTTMEGESARELNRALLSALRRVEKKTRLRAEWTCGKTTERFFDYVPKGARRKAP